MWPNFRVSDLQIPTRPLNSKLYGRIIEGGTANTSHIAAGGIKLHLTSEMIKDIGREMEEVIYRHIATCE